MKKKICSLVLSLLTIFILSSCASKPKPKAVNSVENASKEGQRDIIADKRILIDKDFIKNFDIRHVNVAESNDGYLRVQVEVANINKKPKEVDYQFQWFDLKGMKMDTPSSVDKRVIFKGGEVKYIHSIAPSKDIKDFKLNLQLK